MPQIANLTIKKNDGTTDITYTGVVPSSGEKSPAIWRSLTVGTAAAHQPEFRMVARSNGNSTARRFDVHATYPTLVTSPADGRISVADRVIFDLSVLVPLNMANADVNEAVSQLCNLMSTTLVKDSFKTGFAPT